MDYGCAHHGCHASTREGKLYCPDHVMRHAYVQTLAREIAAREAEVEAVARGATPTLESMLVRETLTLLRECGGATVERLARERGIPHSVSHAVVSVLASAGLVRITRTSRGAIMAAPA